MLAPWVLDIVELIANSYIAAALVARHFTHIYELPMSGLAQRGRDGTNIS
jgi:hypothetical protein